MASLPWCLSQTAMFPLVRPPRWARMTLTVWTGCTSAVSMRENNSFLDCNMKMDCSWTRRVCIRTLSLTWILPPVLSLSETDRKYTEITFRPQFRASVGFFIDLVNQPLSDNFGNSIFTATREEELMEKQICDDFNCLPMISYFKVEQTKRCYGLIKICFVFFRVVEMSLLGVPDDAHSLCRNQYPSFRADRRMRKLGLYVQTRKKQETLKVLNIDCFLIGQ